MSDQQAYQGMADQSSTASDYDALAFAISQQINRVATTAIVKVVGVESKGEVKEVGYVDLQPLVHQIDGNGEPTPHGTIFQAPYFRTHGGKDGKDAVILDPAKGDIGIAVFCSRDSSTVKNSRKENVPGSRRRYDMSDALYLGGILNVAPTQWLRFYEDTVEMLARQDIRITARDQDMYLTAKRDQKIDIGHDVTEKIGHDQTQNTGHDATITVGNDETIHIGSNETITIGSNEVSTIGGYATIKVGSNCVVTVGSNCTLQVGGALHIRARAITIAAGSIAMVRG